MSDYTLDELANLIGVSPRTIRSYIEKGLLQGPDSMGPKARYTGHHIEKLRAILHLKEHEGKSLKEIRQQLYSLSDEALRKIRDEESRWTETDADAGSPADYLRQIGTSEPTDLARR